MRHKTNILVFVLLAFQLQGLAQTNAKPKLVVGIVVDQMRYDYLYRYSAKYGKGGFNRLLAQGYSVTNCHFNYMPTFTGPGHASIYTGCTPSVHGIIANDWWDYKVKNLVYCTTDSAYKTVGIAPGGSGTMAPTRMLTTTMGDELRVNTVKKSKVYGVALKDRGAILPAGHAANGAFWFDNDAGKWISSTYYYKTASDVPAWLNETNNRNKELYLHHLDKPWNTLYDITTYTESIRDDNPYERLFRGETKPVFPHDLPAIQKAYGNYGVIKSTPFGNTITKDFAKILIEKEELGKDEATDMLCISFSSTDYVGHQFGPSSIEMEDTYLRLDKDIEDFLNYLDTKIGKGKYVLFLTADHGAVEVPEYLKEFNIPGGYVNDLLLEKQLDTLLEQALGKELPGERYVSSYFNQQVYLNLDLIQTKDLSLNYAKELCRKYLMSMDEVAMVYDDEDMTYGKYTEGISYLLQNGFNPKRSGSLLVNYQPGVVEYENKGTTHGSPYSYDTHVPLIFFGTGIKKGKTSAYTTITQIAPTICNMLNIPYTNGSSPKIIPFD